MAEAESYAFRPFIKDDWPFISSSWGNSYYSGAKYSDYLSPKNFHSHHRPIRERLLQNPHATIIIAHAKIDPSLIMGWLALEAIPDESRSIILHYLYVKEAFKGLKIASNLLNASLPKDTAILFTHLTEKAQRILNKKANRFNHYQFSPHLI